MLDRSKEHWKRVDLQKIKIYGIYFQVKSWGSFLLSSQSCIYQVEPV
jgi:hypothetical protein